MFVSETIIFAGSQCAEPSGSNGRRNPETQIGAPWHCLEASPWA